MKERVLKMFNGIIYNTGTIKTIKKKKNSIYIGDHRIDIIAGEEANMITGAAAYGYIPLGDSTKTWKADYLFNHPKEINDLLVK